MPKAGFEPARLSASDFKSLASAVPPLRLDWADKQKGKRYALPLERKTRFELATFSLARRRATAAPLPHSYDAAIIPEGSLTVKQFTHQKSDRQSRFATRGTGVGALLAAPWWLTTQTSRFAIRALLAAPLRLCPNSELLRTNARLYATIGHLVYNYGVGCFSGN